MDYMQFGLAVATVVVLFLYVKRRRARLRNE